MRDVVMLDNSEHVARFCPEKFDGDTFIYTEMLDRGKRKGNNGQRLLKTFYHRSREEFWEQWPTIVKLCDMAQVRACTRLAPRSYKKVGREFTRLVVETALTENWSGMKSLYNRACGIAAPVQKIWLFDVDALDEQAAQLRARLVELGKLAAEIPSKKGAHFIAWPFDVGKEIGSYTTNGTFEAYPNVQFHKDNPTNLYIPDGAV